MAEPKPNVLVLCTGNSCRSQMAHGFLKTLLGDKAGVFSAGVATHGLNPLAVKYMAEAGIDISGHTSNHIDEYRGVDFAYVITVCDNAKETCPWFPGGAVKLHRDFPDPSKVKGTEAEVAVAFRATRGLIEEYCRDFARRYFPD